MKNKWLAVLLVVVLLFCFLVSCSSGDKVLEQERVEVLLVCDECEEAGMDINIWQDKGISKVVFSVPNRTLVTQIDRALYDGRYWIKIEYQGKTGWILEDFVQVK